MAYATRALVVEDDDALRELTAEVLSRDGWEVDSAATGADAHKRVIEADYSLLVLDQRLPDADGVELLQKLRADGYDGPAVIVTGFPTVERATAALGMAATDYLGKPLEPRQLVLIGRRAREGHSGHQWKFLWKSIERRHGFRHVVSCNQEARRCYIHAARVADSTAPVLIEGETGTGKEYLARAIHYMSPRADAPFVALNCGAVPDTLLESELFGHEKGAFTSATSAKAGICEMAHRGTLFLDAVGELSPAAQVKLLRFLQERSFTRLGGLKSVDVDVRVIAATNRDLLDAVARGQFREDLYYRLAVMPMYLPPLRERPEDVALFARHFLRDIRKELGRGPAEFSDEAIRILQGHPWSGNLRELHNVIQRSALLAPGAVLGATDVFLGGANRPLPESRRQATLPFGDERVIRTGGMIRSGGSESFALSREAAS